MVGQVTAPHLLMQYQVVNTKAVLPINKSQTKIVEFGLILKPRFPGFTLTTER